MYFFCLMAADRLRAERTGDTIAGNSEVRGRRAGTARIPREGPGKSRRRSGAHGAREGNGVSGAKRFFYYYFTFTFV